MKYQIRAQPCSDDGELCKVPYDIQLVRIPTTAPFTHAVTYRAFSNEAAFRGHPLYSKRQQHDKLPIRFPAGRYTLHTTHADQQEIDLTFLRNFRTAGNVCRPERQKPYIMTNVLTPPELTNPRHLIPPSIPMTGNSMANTPARMRSSPTHGMLNGIGIANQTIMVTDQIPILDNLYSFELRQFIEITTSRAVDDNTALLRIDRRN